MNALRWPTEPRTTMSTPFIEIPQRAAASPWTTSRPPWAVAPADWLTLPSTTTRPDIMFSAIPVLALPRTTTVAQLVHARAVVADVPVDLDLELGVEATGDGVGALRVDDPPARGPSPVAATSWSRWLSSRSGVTARSTTSTSLDGGAHATAARSQT